MHKKIAFLCMCSQSQNLTILVYFRHNLKLFGKISFAFNVLCCPSHKSPASQTVMPLFTLKQTVNCLLVLYGTVKEKI